MFLLFPKARNFTLFAQLYSFGLYFYDIFSRKFSCYNSIQFNYYKQISPTNGKVAYGRVHWCYTDKSQLCCTRVRFRRCVRSRWSITARTSRCLETSLTRHRKYRLNSSIVGGILWWCLRRGFRLEVSDVWIEFLSHLCSTILNAKGPGNVPCITMHVYLYSVTFSYLYV